MVVPSSPPKMLHVLKHETWGLQLHQVLFSVSHVHKWRITSFNSLFLNSLRLFPQMPINPKICLVILCPLAPADLSGRRPYSPSPSSVPCWPSIRRLNLSLWEFRWLRPWIHWTNSPISVWAAEAAHNSSPAEGHELSFSHISFLLGLFLAGYHENQWSLGLTVPLKSSLMEHIY